MLNIKHDLWVKPLVLSAVCVISACGGGGGSSGDSTAPPATANDGAEAAVVAASILAIGDGEEGETETSSSQVRQSSLSRIRGSLESGLLSQTNSSAATTEPCSGGGEHTVSDPAEQDVNSPYTDESFSITTFTDSNCSESFSSDGYTYEFTSNGTFSLGEPISQTYESDLQVYFEKAGGGTAPFQVAFSETGPDGSYAGSLEFSGVVHTRYISAESSYDEQLVIDFSGSFTQPEVVSYQASVGNSSTPFTYSDMWNGDGWDLILNGPMSFSSSELSSCAQGSLDIQTINPIVQDIDENIIGGQVELTLNGTLFVVEFLSDGGANVTINGETTTFSAADIEAIDDECGVDSEL